MNVYEAVNKACKEDTLVEALSFICTWENERAVKQALKQERDADGKMWDTCFTFCIQLVFEKWAVKHAALGTMY